MKQTIKYVTKKKTGAYSKLRRQEEGRGHGEKKEILALSIQQRFENLLFLPTRIAALKLKCKVFLR